MYAQVIIKKFSSSQKYIKKILSAKYKNGKSTIKFIIKSIKINSRT